jgi:hypothetical protein
MMKMKHENFRLSAPDWRWTPRARGIAEKFGLEFLPLPD